MENPTLPFIRISEWGSGRLKDIILGVTLECSRYEEVNFLSLIISYEELMMEAQDAMSWKLTAPEHWHPRVRQGRGWAVFRWMVARELMAEANIHHQPSLWVVVPGLAFCDLEKALVAHCEVGRQTGTEGLPCQRLSLSHGHARHSFVLSCWGKTVFYLVFCSVLRSSIKKHLQMNDKQEWFRLDTKGWRWDKASFSLFSSPSSEPCLLWTPVHRLWKRWHL